MKYNRELLSAKLDRWEKYMNNYTLPKWDDLPDMDLYIEQVVYLVEKYLSLIPHDADNPFITASAINNYVRLKVMPAPVKKKYSRRHLAYAIMICALKQSMQLTEISSILPPNLTDAETGEMYNQFVERMLVTVQVFIGQVRDISNRELQSESDLGAFHLILHSAVSSVLYKILTMKLTGLQLQAPPSEEKPGSPNG